MESIKMTPHKMEENPIQILDTMKMLSWNVRGCHNQNFMDNISNLLKNHKPDVGVLLETKIDKDQGDQLY